MDVLRKELNAFYERQRLEEDVLDYSVLTECKHKIETTVEVERDCRVITDAAADSCYIFGGDLAFLIGLSDSRSYIREINSSDEDEIYIRIHPEDLVEKRMLEYDFFTFVDSLTSDRKLSYKATCRLRIMDRKGEYVYINNTTRILHLSPSGKIWLILCCYELSPLQDSTHGIEASFVNLSSGEIRHLPMSERRLQILTQREKEVLTLIKAGKLSKEIAELLGISLHTVNRHRQNILEKLSVGNSVEAIMAATVMRLL